MLKNGIIKNAETFIYLSNWVDKGTTDWDREVCEITYLGLANKSLILAMLCLRYILQRPRGDAKWAVDTWNWSSGEGQDNEIWEILLHRWYQSHVTVRHHAETVYKYTKKKTKERSVRSKENYEMPCHTCQQKKEEGVS